MVTQTLPARADVPAEYTWRLEDIYPNDSQWENDFSELAPLVEQIATYNGKLGEKETLLEALKLRDTISQKLERLFSYARMRRDEDNTNAHYQALADRAMALWSRIGEVTAYFSPELLQIGHEKIQSFMVQSDGLRLYEHEMHDLFREQEHMLSAPEEALLAAAGEIAGGPSQTYDMLTDADMTFGTIEDEEGQTVELTQGQYFRYIRSTNRKVRENAFHTFHKAYTNQRNTIATLYATQVKSDLFYSRARKYSSSLEASLSKDNIPVDVYTGLIEAVHGRMNLLHRYMEMRKRVLKLNDLHMYDLHVPLLPEVDAIITYNEATEMVAEAVKPMGEGYGVGVKEGFSSRWTDVYETPNKSSGAYSWGVYGVHPFMLLNYQENLRDVFTLAHEMGHSMHTYYSFKSQPYLYSNYTLFVAEVASTLNEEMLIHHLLENTNDRSVRMAVVNYSLEQFRTTLYRQTMFAEFEKIAHERAEAGEALTAEMLSQVHYDLNKLYHGSGVDVDKDVEIEWARIPHFFRSFYVYKYSTGMSAAVALSRQIINEGQPAVDRYIKFLSSGGSDYSINLLKGAGVDMASPEPVKQALDLFEQRLDEMDELLSASKPS
ncbi:MAG: oligoendopeptidase F [Chloroflexota bacterium]|nr:oligoendopeptidase F [Chloroflexota bacterium]